MRWQLSIVWAYLEVDGEKICFKGDFSISKRICAPKQLSIGKGAARPAPGWPPRSTSCLREKTMKKHLPGEHTEFKGEGENWTYIHINAHTHTANRKWPPLFLIPLLYSHHKKNYETQLFIQHFQKFNRAYRLNSKGQALVSDTPNETPSENRIWLRFSRQMKGFFPLSEETQVCKVYRH